MCILIFHPELSVNEMRNKMRNEMSYLSRRRVTMYENREQLVIYIHFITLFYLLYVHCCRPIARNFHWSGRTKERIYIRSRDF